MKKLKLRLFGWIYLLFTLVYALAIVSQYVSPDFVGYLAFLGLGFPILLLIQILFAIWFLIKRRLMVIIPILVVAFTIQPILNTFQWFGKAQEMVHTGGIPIMTYNVRLLDYFGWSGKPGSSEGILETIQEEKPAILCLQEFMVQTEPDGRLTLDNITRMFSFAPHHHVVYNFDGYQRQHGVAIFSAWPILHAGEVRFERTSNLFIFVDLLVEQDTIRVYNAHLQSFHVESEQELIPRNAGQVKRTFSKVSLAFKKRAEQARALHDHIQLSPYPVLVCGDFNDTPVSYTTHTVRKGLVDSFRETGRGFGATYQFIPWLRIDYILHDKSFQSFDYHTGKITGSDHKPIMVKIVMSDE